MTADTSKWVFGQSLFANQFYRLDYTGPAPDLASDTPVVVAFAPFDFPFENSDGGWGSASFSKRGIAHVCVSHAQEDWHQNASFFPAMQACRDAFSLSRPLVAYGFSMGGYAALLAARTLKAKRVVAISPQYTIDDAVVPWDRRYYKEWMRMGPWIHDAVPEVSAIEGEVIVCLDPLHRKDRRQWTLFPTPSDCNRVLLHGAGHAGIQTMIEMGMTDVLFDLLRCEVGWQDLRRAYRTNRRKSFRYLRGVGKHVYGQNMPIAPYFLQLARENGFHRLIKRWG